jgi:hypothetical protein
MSVASSQFAASEAVLKLLDPSYSVRGINAAPLVIEKSVVAGIGGEGGIRTPDTVARMPHFECGAIDHSATSPSGYLSNAAGANKPEIEAVRGRRIPGIAARFR